MPKSTFFKPSDAANQILNQLSKNLPREELKVLLEKYLLDNSIESMKLTLEVRYAWEIRIKEKEIELLTAKEAVRFQKAFMTTPLKPELDNLHNKDQAQKDFEYKVRKLDEYCEAKINSNEAPEELSSLLRMVFTPQQLQALDSFLKKAHELIVSVNKLEEKSQLILELGGEILKEHPELLNQEQLAQQSFS